MGLIKEIRERIRSRARRPSKSSKSSKRGRAMKTARSEAEDLGDISITETESATSDRHRRAKTKPALVI